MPEYPNLLRTNIDAAVATFQSLTPLAGPLLRAADLLCQCLLGGNKLLTCGNGGSASDASHLATEFVSRFNRERRPYPAISLCDVGSTLTAVANDYAFEQVFSRQVRAFGRPGDVLVAFTTSGNSRNVVAAIEESQKLGMASVAFLGRGGGMTKGMATVELLVPSQVTARVQEAQMLLYHTLCELVETKLPVE